MCLIERVKLFHRKNFFLNMSVYFEIATSRLLCSHNRDVRHISDPELVTHVLWISRSILDLDLLLIYRLIKSLLDIPQCICTLKG